VTVSHDKHSFHELGHRHLVDDRVGVPHAGGDLLLVWWKNRAARAHLLFGLTAAATAIFDFSELRIMRAETPAELFTAMKSV
jgi:hypothetical protein